MTMPIPIHRYPELKPEQAEYIRAVDLPLGQRIALVTMRRGELAEKILDACKQMQAPSPHYGEFHKLVEQGYATRNGHYHRLTHKGVVAADDIAQALAKQLGIHHFIPGGSRFYHTLRCTCGWSTTHSRNEGHWPSAMMRMQSRHIASVDAMEGLRTALAPIAPAVKELAQPAEGVTSP